MMNLQASQGLDCDCVLAVLQRLYWRRLLSAFEPLSGLGLREAVGSGLVPVCLFARLRSKSATSDLSCLFGKVVVQRFSSPADAWPALCISSAELRPLEDERARSRVTSIYKFNKSTCPVVGRCLSRTDRIQPASFPTADHHG